MQLVIVCVRRRLAEARRRDGMRSVECLNIAFLAHPQIQRPIRRVPIQPHDITHLVDEVRVGR